MGTPSEKPPPSPLFPVMPRVESTKHLGSQFYHSQFTNSQYLADSSSASPPLSPASQQSPIPAPASTGPASKKKHICSICDRAFTTSGHLARHSRVHTGERNHKCPFPGCETRCSRQDNLQQQSVLFCLGLLSVVLILCFRQLSHPPFPRLA